MNRFYVFRLDGSKVNDAFFEVRTRRRPGIVAYQGRIMSVGPGWNPDLVEVETQDNGAIVLTIVELEPRETAAMVSCRKYLPEPPAEIMQRFARYLDGVEKQCKATADPRLPDIRALKDLLKRALNVTVRTAGALRSANEYLELYALTDRPQRITVKTPEKQVRSLVFGPGANRQFSRRETASLRRAVRVLHAVVVRKDVCDCPFVRWTPPRFAFLDTAVAADPNRYHALDELIRRRANKGMRIDFDQVIRELTHLWRQLTPHPWKPDALAKAVAQFAAVCFDLNPKIPMHKWFDAARPLLEQAGWSDPAPTPTRPPIGRRETIAI